MGAGSICCDRIAPRKAKDGWACKDRPWFHASGMASNAPKKTGLMNLQTIKPWLKPLAGLALLVGLFASLDTEALLHQLLSAHLGWFALGLVAAIAANLLCSVRWQRIGKALHLGETLPWLHWARLYFQGIAVNSVLPGGIVGGDVWRASQFKPLKASGQAVFLERLAGLWGLFCVSLASAVAVVLLEGLETARSWTLPLQWSGFYTLGIALACLLPVLAPRLVSKALHKALPLSLLSKGLSLSVVSQALTVLAFWACLQAVGLELSIWIVGWLASLVFLSALVPASVGGFGARELGTAIILGSVSASPESATAGSLLFGLTATLQGLLGLVFWLADRSGPNASH
jgi:uncharacterized membrane protein YbhN (UPF0104 family)